MKYVADRLVDEKLEEKMVGVAQRDEVAAIRWQSERRNQAPYWLCTPYGELEVICSGAPGCWEVRRDEAPLVHARSPLDEALFTSTAAAKAAGLIHLLDGFGKAPYSDGLWWNIDRPRPITSAVEASSALPADPSISDDHEWGQSRLRNLLKESIAKARAADEELISYLEAVARRWQVPPPEWTKRAHGNYELDTPYGNLVVRRSIGWAVERNGAPLVWIIFRRARVIFDKLEHAKTAALVSARDWGHRRFGDGVRWNEPADEPHMKREFPDQSRVDGASCVVDS